jgi:hypothetical protein
MKIKTLIVNNKIKKEVRSQTKIKTTINIQQS